jgi:hypothetical protein
MLSVGGLPAHTNFIAGAAEGTPLWVNYQLYTCIVLEYNNYKICFSNTLAKHTINFYDWNISFPHEKKRKLAKEKCYNISQILVSAQ